MSFKAEQIARTPYLPDRIADAIKKGVIEGKLTPGERLPTETALAETYGVSRNVVREAIARLRNEGIIESRQGIGAFVLPPPPPVLRLEEHDSLNENDRHRSLFELREALEVRAAELAAVRRDEAEMAAIEEAFTEMARTMDWGKSGVEYDIGFHRAIAAASHNVFMLETVLFIAEHLRESIELTRANSVNTDVFAITIAEHRKILEAIRAADPAAARIAMHEHLSNAAERVGIRTGP